MVFLLTSVISSCSNGEEEDPAEDVDGSDDEEDDDSIAGLVKFRLYECVLADADDVDEEDDVAVAEYDVEVDEDTLVFVWLWVRVLLSFSKVRKINDPENKEGKSCIIKFNYRFFLTLFQKKVRL